VRRFEGFRRLVPPLCLLVAGAGSAAAAAHHSIAMFDGKRVIRITGTITGFRWINPHASIQLDGSASEGEPGAWTIEMQAPSTLMAEGWSRESLSAGDQVTLYVNPTREAVASSGAQRGLYVGAVLPGGRIMGRTDGLR
jgi:hypothetical protein